MNLMSSLHLRSAFVLLLVLWAGRVEAKPLRCVIFDFDSTLSCPTFIARFGRFAIADKRDVFMNMTPPEIVENFGGTARLEHLTSMLQRLRDLQVHLMIISLGRTECIIAHLAAVHLLPFFSAEDIYGRDSEALKRHNIRYARKDETVGTLFCKAALILAIMTRFQWTSDDVLFVDDSTAHIQAARDGAMTTKDGHRHELWPGTICQTLLVANEGDDRGLAAHEMEHVCQVAAGEASGSIESRLSRSVSSALDR